MADDRRADHQYSVNRPPDAKRPVVIHAHDGRPQQIVAGHTTTIAHMPQSDSTGRRSNPTPPPRRPSPVPARVAGGKPGILHIQLPGSNEVIPVHIPVQAGAQATVNIQRPASRGSPSAGAYVLHTGVVMPGGNVITIPATLAATQQQRRTPSPKVATSVRTEVIGQQRLTPPPPPATSRVSPVMFHHQAMTAGASGALLAPPNGGNRSTSPRSSAITAAQVPQLLITPAQAQLLGVSTTTALTPSQQVLAAQKLAAAQLELNKVQQQQHHLAIAANMITTSATAVANSNLSQKVLSSALPRSTATELVVETGSVGQQRPPSVPSTVSHATVTVESITQPVPTHPHSTTNTAHSISLASTLPPRKDSLAVRRLPVNTEPQRFFASSDPTVPNSSEVSWSSSASTTTSSRPQRPASHPNLPVTTKSSNLRQPHELSGTTTGVAQRTGVVPNGIDMANANGDTHKPLARHSDSRPRTTSPANAQVQSSNQQHTLVSQSSLTAYQQLLLQQQNQQQLQQKPYRVHHSHRLPGKSHSEIPRSMVNHNTDNEVPMPKLVPEKSIPPLISTKRSQDPQTNIKQEDIKMERLISPFNMRVRNLDNFPASQSTYRANYRSQAFAIHRAKSFQNAVQRARTGSITNAAKSLDLLRQNLQKHINQEIDIIIQRYMTYFTPGIKNIRMNNGDSTVTDDHVLAVCRQILEEAKKMYGDAQAPSGGSDVKMDTDRSRSPSNNLRENQDVRAKKINLFNVPKRRGSSDSDVSIPKKKKKGRPPLHGNSASGRSTPSKQGKAQDNVKREGPKWDPERLDETTKFIMGAKANKALGLGNTRGRLYIKHPDVFKYSGDQDDKQWLFEHQYMPATGGKAYMLVEEDIRELAMTDEYRANPGLLLEEIHGFAVPPWLIEKMKKQMQAMRSDQPKPPKNRSRSATPNAIMQENTEQGADPPLPFSTMSDQTRTENVPSPSQSLDLLGVDGDDVDLQDVSPYNMTGGFVTMSPGPASMSPAPSDLDGLDDDTTPFGTTD